MQFSEIYRIGCGITGVLIFIGSWIYCIASYGFLFGVGLGWLPSIIVAFLGCWLWPLFAVGILLLIAAILFG